MNQSETTSFQPHATDRLTDQLHNLRVFLRVARAHSISQAAKAMFRAPSAVSRSIIELEQALGVTLFERNARGILLNDFGRLSLIRAERISAEVASAAAELQRAAPAPLSAGAVDHLLFNGRKMQLLIKLADTRKISLAGTQLGISQSGASMSLSRIEAALGLALFHRAGQGMVATEATNRIVMRGKRVMAEMRHLLSDIAAVQGQISGTVVIGSLPLGRTHIFPMAVTDVMAKHSNIRVTTIDSTYEQMIMGLRSGHIDAVIGVMRDEAMPQGLVVENLFDDELHFVVRDGHPALAQGVMTLEQMRQMRLVLPWANSPSRTLFNNMYLSQGLVPPEPAIESADFPFVRQVLLASDAAALVSGRQFAGEVGSGVLHRLDVTMPELKRLVGLILRERAMLPPAVMAVVEALRARAAMETQ